MIETAHFYESFFSEVEMILVEVEQYLQSVVIECPEHDALELSANGLELNKADSIMISYLRMVEITRSLESILDKLHHNDIALNGHINSLVEAAEVLKSMIGGISDKFSQSNAPNKQQWK